MTTNNRYRLIQYSFILLPAGVIRTLTIIIILSFWCLSSYSQPHEYTLKTIYIEKITRFIEWPDSCKFHKDDQSFTIHVLGNTALKASLKNIFSIQKIYERPVKIKEIKSVEEIETCHVLFIAADQEKNLDKIIHKFKNRPVLTIGDTPGYCKKGVLINFFVEEGDLKFNINHRMAQKSPLDFSFYLLNIAKAIDTKSLNYSDR